MGETDVIAAQAVLTTLGAYLLIAYGVLPFFWRHYEHNARLASVPKTASISLGLPGDPLNVAVVGDEDELAEAMARAGWAPANALTLKSGFRVVESVAFVRPYRDAPVSNLFLWGRKEDRAFEEIDGGSPRRRHHVRFWRAPRDDASGRPLWVGAATYDVSVGLSRYTYQVTPHIAPDIDAERGKLVEDLVRTGLVSKRYEVTGVGPVLSGRNGERDLYYTDGEMAVVVLDPARVPRAVPPEVLPSPKPVRLKNRVWAAVKHVRAG